MRILRALFAVAALGVYSTPYAADVPRQATTQLPRNVVPTHYDVSITPDAKSLTFSGKVTVSIDVLEATNTITLNAVEMTFDSVVLSGGPANAAIAAPKIQFKDSDQTATFTFAKPLEKGSYKLAVAYRGKIGTQAFGLFAIDYDTKNGAKRALYTQFENSDARRMIPSWDEPSHKATFTLEAVVPSNQMAISNMPIAQRSDAGNGLSRVRFGQSPKMSTYLLFFGLGEFDRITAKAGPTEVGVITQAGISNQGQFALEASKAVLQEYNDYFGTPYPLPKLDNVASPGRSQFFSAMENWGAIYTFEYAILNDPSISTQADKQSAFNTAAHEIAHQWFGDLVTMSWWDDLWLNEGFATWMAGRTTAKLHPEWNTKLSIVDGRESAIGRDSLATTHPVVQKIDTVEQASQAFDAITYQKGSAVIRMLEDYVGEEAWKTGVRQYIKKHSYGNTVNDDLWNEIEAAAKKPILAIAHDFTLQPGVPLLRIGNHSCMSNVTTFEITQGEFSKDQPNKKPLIWRVPVIVQPLKGAPIRTMVTNGKATVKVPGCDPVVVNAGQAGYYRTLYSPGHFSMIKDSFASLSPIDQLGILTDTWQLGLSGYRSTADALDLAGAANADADPKVWGAIADVFDSIDDYYRGDETKLAKFRPFAISRLSPVLARIGWTAKPNELDAVAILRNNLIATLGDLGDEKVIAEARRRYAASKTDATALPAAIRKTTMGVVALHADAATWDQIRAAAKAEKTALVKDQYYALLASAKDKALAQRALDLSLTDEPGATNSATMIARVANLHPELAFDFAVAHIDTVNKKVDGSARANFYPGLAANSHDPSMTAKVKSFAEKHVAESSRRGADTAIARIQYRIKVRSEQLPAIDRWLAAKS